MDIYFNLDRLTGADRRIAEYLARLAQYREIAARFAKEIAERGEGSIMPVRKAQRLLSIAEEAAVNDMMLPSSEAAARLGYSRVQVARLCREHGQDGDHQVRCEKRFGNSWYVYVPDIKMLMEAGEIHGPYKKCPANQSE